MSKSEKDLVTGGAGFLGYHLAAALVDMGREVVIADNFVRSDADPRFDSLIGRRDVTFLEGDLCDPLFVSQLPEVSRVFHLAALNGTQNFYDRPFEVIQHSTMPTVNLLARYSQSGISSFYYTGTSESYAGAVSRGIAPIPTPENVPLVIDDVMNPRWSYAAAKMHGEVAVASAGTQFGFPWQIWRIHNCFGPRMGAKHVIPDFTERAARDVFELYGADQTRTFLYVRDAVQILTRLAKTRAAYGRVINIGGTDEMTMSALADHIMTILRKNGEVVSKPAPSGSIARRRPDTTLLTELLDGIEHTPFDQALRSTVEDVLDDVRAGKFATK